MINRILVASAADFWLNRSISYDIAANGTQLFWADYIDEKIKSRPLAGGQTPTVLINSRGSVCIAIDSAYVYYIRKSNGNLQRVPLAGGSSENLVSGLANVTGLAVDESYIYCADETAGIVYRVPIAGGTATAFISTPCTKLYCDDTYLFITDRVGGRVYRALKADGTGLIQIATGLTGPNGICGDTGNLYIADTAAGSVITCKKDGTDLTAIATGEGAGEPVGIALAGDTILWSMFTSGTVRQIEPYIDSAGVPKIALFKGADHVSAQIPGFYIAYRETINRVHKHILFIFVLSRFAILVFGRKTRVLDIAGTAMRLRAYCKQSVFLWRIFVCDGYDASIDPLTSEPVGNFTGRVVTFSAQPPAESDVSVSNPAATNGLTIHSMCASVPFDCGQISIVQRAVSETDEEDADYDN